MGRSIDLLRHLKREAAVLLRTGQQRARFRHVSSADLPIIFGNAMPKSGSHILMQFLEGLTEIAPFVMRAKLPVRTLTLEGRKRSEAEILRDLTRLRHGEMGWGYVRGMDAAMTALNSEDHVAFFVFRDPRDKIISHIFYGLEIHEGHRLRTYYRDHLHSMEERIAATIRGIPDEQYFLPSIAEDYKRYLPWLDHPRTLAVRFEDLVNNRDRILLRMLEHVEETGYEFPMPHEQALDVLEMALDPGLSPTFREGKSGGWRKHFSPENIALFKEVTGDLLQNLGYEDSYDW